MDYIETGRIACSNSFWRKSIQIMRRALGVKASSLLDELFPQISVLSKKATWHFNSGVAKARTWGVAVHLWLEK
jgi:hypothetical protein